MFGREQELEVCSSGSKPLAPSWASSLVVRGEWGWCIGGQWVRASIVIRDSHQFGLLFHMVFILMISSQLLHLIQTELLSY